MNCVINLKQHALIFTKGDLLVYVLSVRQLLLIKLSYLLSLLMQN